jgi:succinoglycan biosynthesis protein ExoA
MPASDLACGGRDSCRGRPVRRKVSRGGTVTSVMSDLPDPAAAASAAVPPLLMPAAEPVSVIMPARNEERYLAESVRHVLSQDYDGEMELIIAVGPSRDATAELARGLAAADPRITVVENPTGQRPAAMNIALQVCRHPVVVRVDGHAMLPPGYIRTALATMRETGAVNVGGIMAAEGTTPFQQAVAWAMTSPFGVGAARFHTGGEPGPSDTAYMGVFRREAIEQAGGYNEQFQIAEDWELNHRIRQGGGLIWFQPAMRVSYRPRASVADLASQYFRYGRWRRVVARQHTGTINLRYLAAPIAVGAVAVGTLAGLAGVAGLAAGAGAWAGVATAGFVAPLGYAAAVGALGVMATRELPPRAAARVPLALATMHMSWGAGFISSPRRLVRQVAQGRLP